MLSLLFLSLSLISCSTTGNEQKLVAKVVQPTCYSTAQLALLTVAQKQIAVDNNKAAGLKCN